MYKYKIYLTAALLAVLMTVFIAPETQEGNAMSPLLNDGDIIVLLKQAYSQNRGMPEKGELIVLKKNAFGDDSQEDNPIRTVSGLPGDTVKLESGKSIIVKENQVFVTAQNLKEETGANQNRLDLIDSKEIRGRVIIRLWPLDGIGGF